MKGKRKAVRNVFKTLFDYLFEQVWNPEGGFKKVPIGGNFFSPFPHFSFNNVIASNSMCTMNIRYSDLYDKVPQHVSVQITPRLFLNHTIPGFDLLFDFKDGMSPIVKFRLIAQNPYRGSKWAERAVKGERIMWVLGEQTPPMNWIGRIVNGHYRIN